MESRKGVLLVERKVERKVVLLASRRAVRKNAFQMPGYLKASAWIRKSSVRLPACQPSRSQVCKILCSNYIAASGRAPLFLCPADGFAPDDGGGEFELGGAGGEAVDAVEKNLGGEGGHIFYGLADAGDGRFHIVHIGVIVK